VSTFAYFLDQLYLLFLFLSNESRAAQWLQRKTAQVMPNEAGQGMVEYALILCLVAIVVIIIF
jgi:hypothetical protein